MKIGRMTGFLYVWVNKIIMVFGLAHFPGSIGIEDFKRILQGFYQVDVSVFWYLEKKLPEVDAIIIPGGYSFGDYPYPGMIAGKMPIMELITDYADAGRIVIGFGNGFQILCQSGMLPGNFNGNSGTKVYNNKIFVKADNNDTALTLLTDKETALNIPVSLQWGSYFLDKETLSVMRQNHQILFRYCDDHSRISEACNPDGSIENIAGICNLNKNVFGLMLHPERAVEEDSGSTDGRTIFESLLKHL